MQYTDFLKHLREKRINVYLRLDYNPDPVIKLDITYIFNYVLCFAISSLS